MNKAVEIRSINGDASFGLIVHDGQSFKAISTSDDSGDWATWVNNSCTSLSDAYKSIGIDLYATDSRPLTNDELLELGLEEPKSDQSPTIECVGSDDGYRRRYVSLAFKSGDFPVSASSMPLTYFSAESRQNVIHYKVMSARYDNLQLQIGYSVKKVRAIFDPNLGPKGGYRCPVGTEFGGYITDRFGRGCGAGIARRVGRALSETGRTLERIGENRQLDRLQRAQNRTMRSNSRAQRATARAERAALRLERGAERLVGEYRPTQGRRGVPGNRPSPTRRIVAARPGATRRRVIVPPAGQRVRTQGARPRPRPNLPAGRRGSRLVDVWTPSEYRRGDKKRIKNRPNRYAEQPDAIVLRALKHFSPKPISKDNDKAKEARRRQQRLEVLQEMVNRGMDIPEEFRREVRVYKLKPQRSRRSTKRRERTALALERGAERILRGRERRQRRRERQNGVSRRDRMSLALERGAERVLNGRRSPSQPPRPPVSPRVAKRTVTRTPAQPANLRRPQPKRVTGSKIKYSDLAPAQKRRVTQRANAEFLDVDARWRRRLELGPNDKISNEDIDKYLKDRKPLVSERAHGSLRADAHDWDVLSEWKSTKNGALLDDLGPRRRNKIASESGITGTPSQRAKKVPAKAPTSAKKTPAKKVPAKKVPEKKTPAKKASAKKGRTTGTGAKTTPSPKKKAPAKPATKPKPAKKTPTKPTPAKKAPAKASAAKPKASPKPNLRSLRTTDEYKKAKENDATLSRIVIDAAQRVAKTGNKGAIDRQIALVDRQSKKYKMIFDNAKTPDADKAQILAFLEGMRDRRRELVKIKTSMKVSPKKNG